jgi:hypothetical protein
VLTSQARIDAILRLVDGLDHVGFLASGEGAAEVRALAAAAGFGLGQRTFESTILARQLAQLAGLDAVQTTIFKASRSGQGEAGPGVEVALPREVDAGLVRDWIQRRIGTHVAFRVTDPSHFGALTRIVEEEGYRMPEFLGGRPAANPSEALTAVFFDRRPANPVGLEFCHYAG